MSLLTIMPILDWKKNCFVTTIGQVLILNLFSRTFVFEGPMDRDGLLCERKNQQWFVNNSIF